MRYNMISDYAYTNARIKGMKSFLLEKNELKLACEFKTLKDFANWLETTLYKGLQEFGKNAYGVERGLFINWVATNRKVLRIMPKSAKKFFEARLKGYEIVVLKLIINSKLGYIGNLENYVFLLSKRLAKLAPKLISAKNTEEVIHILADTMYEKVLEKEKKENGEEPTLSLDKYYFSELWKSIKTLSKRDRKIAKRLIGIEIDALNLTNIFRKKITGKSTTKLLIPFGYYLKKDLLRECVRTENIKDAVSLLANRIYGKILSEVLQDYEKTHSLFCFEQALKKYIIKQNRLAMYDIFQIGVGLGFLKLKEVEIQNLRAIAIGIEKGLPKAEIEEMVMW